MTNRLTQVSNMLGNATNIRSKPTTQWRTVSTMMGIHCTTRYSEFFRVPQIGSDRGFRSRQRTKIEFIVAVDLTYRPPALFESILLCLQFSLIPHVVVLGYSGAIWHQRNPLGIGIGLIHKRATWAGNTQSDTEIDCIKCHI